MNGDMTLRPFPVTGQRHERREFHYVTYRANRG